MAVGSTEIEIKIPVLQERFLDIENQMQQIGEFLKETRQIDTYFTPQHRNFVEPAYVTEWLSLRQRGEKSILNYKYWHYPDDPSQGATHCDEYETEILNPEQLKKILDALNCQTLITVDKKRKTYRYQDRFEIALDEVQDLGYFVEIETIKDLGNIEKATEELFLCATKLGLDPEQRDKRGYPFLLLAQKGLRAL